MKWSAIRVSEETKQELEAIRETWIAFQGSCKNPIDTKGTRSGAASKNDVIGLDQIIKRLAWYWRQHGERRKKSRKARRAASKDNSAARMGAIAVLVEALP